MARPLPKSISGPGLRQDIENESHGSERPIHLHPVAGQPEPHLGEIAEFALQVVVAVFGPAAG